MRRSVSVLGLGLALLAFGAGCKREKYRQRTDRDVSGILAQKNVVPSAPIQNWNVYPDGRARFADPTAPDRPPMPPDDELAKILSPNPQRPGRAGIFRVEGDGLRVQPPTLAAHVKDAKAYWYRDSRYSLHGDFEFAVRYDLAQLGLGG